MDHRKVASQIISAVGKNNFAAAAHCATRLRLVVKDEDKIDQNALDNNEDVKGTFKSDGQYQIIIGPGDVNNVYDELVDQANISPKTTEEVKKLAQKDKKFNPIMAFIKMLSDIFVPIIPALVAGGLLMALNNFLVSGGLFGPKSVVEMIPAIKGLSDMIQLMSSAAFIFMPILVGISSAKRFGANQYLGAALAMMMVSPDLVPNNSWDIFGLAVSQNNYYYQVIPVIAAVYILSILEKWFHKRLPSAVDFTFTPLLSLMITGFLTFVIVGPLMRLVSDGITDGIVWIYKTLGFIGTGIFGLLYSPIVLTGLHQSFPAIETQLITAFTQNGTGYGDFIFVVASMANVAQGAATFGVFALTKNKKMKGLSSSATISAILGITEPALFGVNLKYRFPFFCALVGSGIAATFAGLFHVIAVSLGSAGLLGFLSINAKSIPMFLLCELISFIIAFALTYVYGKRNYAKIEAIEGSSEADIAPEEGVNSEQSEVKLNDEVITAPVTGDAESLTQVNDQVFSSKLMGNGVAVRPKSDKIYAPVSGEVTVAYETKHAYGIKSDKGAEILLHLGIDTVELKGKYFESQVIQGQRIEKGQVIGSFDRQKIREAGYDNTVIMAITNTKDFGDVQRIQAEEVEHGDQLVAVSKK